MINLLLIVLAVALGLVLSKFIPRKSLSFRFFLTFSGAFLLSVNLLELFPEVFSKLGYQAGIWILGGVGLQIVLEFFTRGLEHGHGHFIKNPAGTWSLILGIMVHSFFEGLPLHQDPHHHLSLAIALHKIPIALLLWVLLTDYFGLHWKAILGMAMFTLAAPLGYWLGGIWTIEKGHPLAAVLAGIFLHISTVIIFESTEGHRFNTRKLIAVLGGFLLGILSVGWH